MSATYQVLANFAQGAGVLYFLAMFLAAVFYALKPSNRDTFDAAARIPLSED